MRTKVKSSPSENPDDNPQGLSKEKKKTKKRSETYGVYIYRTLKEVHPDLKISKHSMKIVNNFVEDFFEKLCIESSKLLKIGSKNTLSSRDLQASVKLVLPRDLATHANCEGMKAVAKFGSSKNI